MQRRVTAIIASALLAAAACGGADTAGNEVATPQTPQELTPPDLALRDLEVALAGPTRVEIRPGGSVSVAHVLSNVAGRSRSLAVVARSNVEGLVADPSPASVRLDAGSSSAITTTISVDPDLAVGETAVVELTAVNVDDTDQRVELDLEVTVVDSEGAAPDIGADRVATATDQKVVIFVVGNDPDPDGDVDLASLRVVGGGDLAATVTANADGTVVYEPFSNLVGTDVVLYELCDLAGNCDTGAITITIG